jgi:hypothetical protein
MPATLHPFPVSLSKLTLIRGLADHIGDAIASLGPDSDLAVPALCSVVFDIATNSPDPELCRRAAMSLRVVAGLIEEHST